jgi:hypothetical protein
MLNILLIIILIVILLPYIMQAMPNEVESLLNNTLRTFNNTFRVLDVGSGMAASTAADVSGGFAFASEGKNPLDFI